MQKQIRATVAKALALTLALSVVGISAPDADAAKKAKKPKLSKSKVTVAVKKKAKIKIKNVKAKKVKKLTVKSTKKSIASVKKNGKTAFTITGKKAGRTTVKANVKVGKKTTKLKVSVKVTAGSEGVAASTVPPAGTASAPAASTGAPASTAPSAPPSEAPTETPKPTPLINYSEDFENGLGDWFARGNESKLMVSSEAHTGSGAALIYDRQSADGKAHAWNGPAIDLSQSLTPGGKYKVSFWAKVPEEDAALWSSCGGIELLVSGAKYYTKEDLDNGAEPSCENYPADTSYPIKIDEWTKIELEFTAPDYFYQYIFYIETPEMNKDDILIRYGKARFLIDDFTMERLSAPAEFDPNLPSIKEAYGAHGITVGVAASYGQLMNLNTFGFIKHHFGSVTAGNEMKLDALMGAKKTLKLTDEKAADYVVDDAYKACPDNKDKDGNVIVPDIDFSALDSYLKIAKENGLKVRIHSPFWHQQNPQFFFTKNYKRSGVSETDYTDKETMYTREEMYVRTLLEHIFKSGYGDVVAAYDVVNEYLNMKNEGDTYVNYWKFIFGTEVDLESTYVKKAFAVAYDELVKNNRTDISLIYNDYNTYNQPDKVVALINNINKKDDLNPDGNKLCDGIGMQSHFNGDGDEDKFEAAVEAFKAAGFEIQITELDVTNCGKVTTDSSEEIKALVWEKNAAAYKKIMDAILRQKASGANITSVTFWGLNDATSWRSEKAPLLFGNDVADKKPSFDAVIDAAKNFKG